MGRERKSKLWFMRKLLSTLELEKTRHAAFNITADKNMKRFMLDWWFGSVLEICYFSSSWKTRCFILTASQVCMRLSFSPGQRCCPIFSDVSPLHLSWRVFSMLTFFFSWVKMLSHIFWGFPFTPLMKNLFHDYFISTYSGPSYHQYWLHLGWFFCFCFSLRVIMHWWGPKRCWF